MTEGEPSFEERAPDTTVLREDGGPGVTILTLNRPDKLNALTVGMRAELARAVGTAASEESCRVIIVRGAGRAFSSGADVEQRGSGETLTPSREQAALEQRLSDFLRLWDAPVPVIAQVHGYCLGVATVLCACCDLVLAADDAVFGWPKLPLGAGMIGPTWAWHVGVRRAKELSYQVGAEISGAEAVKIGFANASYPSERLGEEVSALAERIARTPRELLRIKKLALNAVPNQQGFREAVLRGASWDALAHASQDVAEVRATVAELGLGQAISRYAAPPKSGL